MRCRVQEIVAKLADSQQEDLTDIFESWMQLILDLPVWSPTNIDGRRIPWWALEAARYRFKGELAAPGIYMFGVEARPMYLGKSSVSLLSRLRKRYIRGSMSQFQLAMMHSRTISREGLVGFPDEIQAWYTAHFNKGNVRLRHAVELARVGIDRVWISLLPLTNNAPIKLVERRMISAASKWNQSCRLSPLLNVQHAG